MMFNLNVKFLLVVISGVGSLQASQLALTRSELRSYDDSWQAALISRSQISLDRYEKRVEALTDSVSILKQQEADIRNGLQGHADLLKGFGTGFDDHTKQLVFQTQGLNMLHHDTVALLAEQKSSRTLVETLQKRVRRLEIGQQVVIGCASFVLALHTVLITFLWNR